VARQLLKGWRLSYCDQGEKSALEHGARKVPRLRLASQAQNHFHQRAQDLIGQEEKQRRHRHHNAHEDCRYPDFPERRPCDFADFLADFIDELDWVHSHGSVFLSVTPDTAGRVFLTGRIADTGSSPILGRLYRLSTALGA
jgi:hypothetical protein